MKQLIVGIVFLVGSVVAQGASADDRYVVSGQVKTETLACLQMFPPCEAVPSEPITVDGARIEIRRSNGSLVKATRSRYDGRFKVLLKRGAYRLSIPEFGKETRFRVESRAKNLGTILVRPEAPAAQ